MGYLKYLVLHMLEDVRIHPVFPSFFFFFLTALLSRKHISFPLLPGGKAVGREEE